VSALPEVLATALAQRPLMGGIALVSARSGFLVCRVAGGELVTAPGLAVPSDVYEVRAVLTGPDGDGELRFHAPDRVAFVPAPGEERAQRVLLGTVVDAADEPGWVRLREARMRDVLVPHDGPVASDDRLALVIERIIHEDEDGNVHVVDEVLVGLERVEEER
jgi:hypothetical protein